MTDKIIKELFSLKDEKYQSFTASLIPTIEKEKIIGVRLPVLRKLSAKLQKEKDLSLFLSALPHKYHEENLLHALIINKEKDIDRCLSLIQSFLPYVDNWAVCDSIRPAVLKKHPEKLISHIYKWLYSELTYTRRFAIEMLMLHFLDESFKVEYAEAVSQIECEEYYLKMMIAWYFATALAKQWELTVVFLEEKILPPRIHNKTIQKAVESYRISEEKKDYLKTLRIKIS